MFSWYRKPARIVGGLEMDQEEIGSREADEGGGGDEERGKETRCNEPV